MSATRKKPQKPRRDFPLTPHSNGQWCRKIPGRIRYFGPWHDPAASESQYLRDRKYLQAGRQPPTTRDGCRIVDLVNRFLTVKKALVHFGELAPRSFRDSHKACELSVPHFGRERLVSDIRVEDFDSYRAKLSKRRGLNAIGTQVTLC